MTNWLSHLRVREIPPGVWALGIVSLLMDLSSEIIHALLPLYLVTIVGVSMLTIGIIEGVAEAIAQIVKMFSGALSDRLGQRKLLAIIGYGLAAITKPIFPLATTLSWLIAARFIDRVGKGIRGAPRDALIADLTPEGARGASFGLRQSLDTIGAFLGPLAAILIMAWTANNFTIAFWVAVIPAFAAVVVLLVWVKEPKRAVHIEPVRSPLSRSELKALPIAYWFTILVAAIFTLARFSEAFLLLRAQAEGITLALIPAFLVVMNVFYALSSWPAGALSDRIGRYPTATAGFAILIAANLVLALSESVALIGLGVALWGLHMGLTQGVLSAMVADHAPPRLRGSAFGLFHLVTGLAALLASVIAGGLWQWFGPQLTFLAGAGFTLAALLLLPFVPSQFGGRAKA